MYKYVYKVQLYVEWERPTKPYMRGMASSNQTCYVISDKKYDDRHNDDLVKECKETLERTILSFADIRAIHIIDVNCTECNMQYNEYLPENFYLLLHYLRAAIHIYHNEEDPQKISEILKKLNGYNINTHNGVAFACPDTEYILAKASYQSRQNIFQYYDKVLQEIINTLSIKSIKLYDKIGCIAEIETTYNKHYERNSKEDLLNKIQEGMHILFRVLRGFSTSQETQNIRDYKYRLMFQHIKDLKASSLEESLKYLKRSIILNHKQEVLFREPMEVSLDDSKNDPILSIDQTASERIIKAISEDNNRSRTIVGEMLEEFNKEFHIMSNPTLKKKDLAAYIYIMYYSQYVRKSITYKEFQNRVCDYYGKPNMSFKPNDVKDEAEHEYKRQYFIKKYNINFPQRVRPSRIP